MRRRIGRPKTPQDMRMAIALPMLAGATFLHLMATFRIGKTTVYDIFHDSCDVLNDRLKLPGLPETVEGLTESARPLKTSREPPSPLRGCILAIDGITVKIEKPPSPLHLSAFYCRKGYFSIPVQAMLNCNYVFLAFSACCEGSEHDYLAYSFSGIGRYLNDKRLCREFWLVGDEPYVCNDHTNNAVPGVRNERVGRWFLLLSLVLAYAYSAGIWYDGCAMDEFEEWYRVSSATKCEDNVLGS